MRLFLLNLLVLVCSCLQAQSPKLILPEGNTSPVTSQIFSPDGAWVLTSGNDDLVCLWEVASGKLISSLRHEYGVNEAGFLKEGPGYYSIDKNNIIRIVRLAAGTTQVLNFKDSTYGAFINASANMYAHRQDETTIHLYDLPSEKRMFTCRANYGYLNVYAFTPGGRYLATATMDSSVLFWNVQTGTIVKKIPALASYFNFSADGSRMFTYDKNEGQVWDVETETLLFRINNLKRFNYQVCFSPDGKRLVINDDQMCLVWDVTTGVQLSHYFHDKRNTMSSVFTPDGQQVLTSFDIDFAFSNQASSVLWDAATGEPLKELKNCFGKYTAANFSNKGLVVVGGYAQSQVLDLSTLQVKQVLRGRIQSIRLIQLTRNGKLALVNTLSVDSAQMQLLDIEKGKLLFARKEPQSESDYPALSPDNQTALFYIQDSAVQLYDFASGRMKGELDKRGSNVNYVVFSTNGDKVATLRSADSTLGVWDVQQQKQMFRFKVAEGVARASFSPDHKYIAVASPGVAVQIRDATTGKLIVRLPGITETGDEPLFTHTGTKLIVSGGYGEVRVFATAGWKQLFSIRMPKPYQAFMDLSPDETKLLLYNEEAEVLVYDMRTGKKRYRLAGDLNKGVWSYFSKDSKRIYLPQGQEDVAEYDSETGVQLRLLKTYGLHMLHPQAGLMVSVTSNETKLIGIKDGMPLYSFFGFDGEEYLVTDAKGRFDGTDLAKKLLYMTCATEIIALEQVKDLLYVPHLAERIMQGETINSTGLDAITICSQVPLVAAPVNTDHFIEYTITPQQGGLSDVALMVNAIEVKRYKKDELQQQGNNYVVKIEKEWVGRFYKAGETNEVQIKAYTGSNNLYARGVPVAETPAAVDRTPPNLFAVFIGVSDYKGETLDLGFAAKDADDLGRVFGTTAQKLLNTQPGEQHVFLYRLNTGTNRSGFPDKNTIKKTFEEIGSKAGPNDILLVFFAGHGVMQGQEQQFYFLTADAGPQQTDDEVQQTGISSAELMDWIQPLKVKAQKRILIFDACNSGQALKDFVTIGDANQQFAAARNDAEGKRIKVIEKLNERAGFFIYSASASSQSAYEYLPYQQGLLTYSLLKTIKENPSVLEGGQFLDLSKWLNASKDLLEALVQQLKRKQDPQLNSSATIHVGVVDDEVRKQIKLSEELPLFGRSEFRNSNMRVDNLNLRKTMDALLETTREVLFDKQYEGDEVYNLSGDYTITNGIMKVTVLLLKGGTTIVEEYNETGSPTELNELCRKLMIRVLKRKL